MTIYIIGFFFISILGTLLHFTYDLSNHNKYIGIFSAVNESTWEHIKMCLTAAFIWCLIDGLFFGSNPNYLFSKLISILIIIIFIPMIFYGIKLLFRKSFLIIDILNFYITIFLSQYVGYKLLTGPVIPFFLKYISAILLLIIFSFYLLLTYHPFKFFVFKDPITNKYGFKGH